MPSSFAMAAWRNAFPIARLPGYGFVVPDHVREEITDANQRAALDDAVVRSVLRIEAITDLGAVTLFTELIAHIDRGEAA